MGSTTADASAIDYLQRARELAPELAATADKIERQRELPEPIVEEIAKADASTAWC